MLINIDPSTGTVTRLDGQEENGLLETCDRLKEELGGWLDYRKLAGKEERYGKVAPTGAANRHRTTAPHGRTEPVQGIRL